MIRKATEKDIAGVTEIYNAILELESRGEITTGWLPGIYPVEATARAALNRDDLFVMEEDGRICAAAVLNKIQVDVYADGNWKYEAEDDKVMVIHTLVVDPECGKKGYGRKFVEYYENYARENGCSVLRMDTNEKNVVARSMYKKLGYTEPGIVPCNFNGIPNVNLVLLEKAL